MHTPKVSLCDASEVNEIYMTGIVGTENTRSCRILNCINYSSPPVHKTCFLHWARLQMAYAKFGIAPNKSIVVCLLLSRNSSSLNTFMWASSTANFIKIGWKVQNIGKNFIYVFTYSMFFSVPLLTTHRCSTSLCRDIRYRIWCKSDKQCRMYK